MKTDRTNPTRSRKPALALAAAAGSLAAVASSHGAVISSVWKDPVNGNWKTAALWTNGTPSNSDIDNGFRATINKDPAQNGAPYTVTLDSNAAVGGGRFEGDVIDFLLNADKATFVITNNAIMSYYANDGSFGVNITKGTLRLKNGSIQKRIAGDQKVSVDSNFEVEEKGSVHADVAHTGNAKLSVIGTPNKPADFTVLGNVAGTGAVTLKATAGNNQTSGASMKVKKLTIDAPGSFTTSATLTGNGSAAMKFDGSLENNNAVTINARTAFVDSAGNKAVWENKKDFKIDIPVVNANLDKLVLSGGNVAANLRPTFKQSAGTLEHRDQFFGDNINFDYADGTILKRVNFTAPGTIQLTNSKLLLNSGNKPAANFIPTGAANFTLTGASEFAPYATVATPTDPQKPRLNKNQTLYLQPGDAAKTSLTVSSDAFIDGKVSFNVKDKPAEIDLGGKTVTMNYAAPVDGDPRGYWHMAGTKDATFKNGNFTLTQKSLKERSQLVLDNRTIFELRDGAKLANAGTISLNKGTLIIDADADSRFAMSAGGKKGLVNGNGLVVCPKNRLEGGETGIIKPVKRVDNPPNRPANDRSIAIPGEIVWDGGFDQDPLGELQIGLEAFSADYIEYGLLRSINGTTSFAGQLSVFLSGVDPAVGTMIPIVFAESPVSGAFSSGISPDGYVYPINESGPTNIRFSVAYNAANPDDPSWNPYNVTLIAQPAPTPGTVSLLAIAGVITARRKR